MDKNSSPSENAVRRRRAPRGAGDQLRDKILDAATELLLRSGHGQTVAIRAVAQRVGVTPPSIYLHFADKDSLLDAVCARYFENLDDKLRVAADNCTTGADLLHAQGMAYVRFALQAPKLYQLATMAWPRPASSLADPLFTPAISQMRAVVQSMIDDGTYFESDAKQITYELFTAVHGVVALFIAKPYWPLGDAEAFADKVLRAMCYGQIATGIMGSDNSSRDAIEHLLSWPTLSPPGR